MMTLLAIHLGMFGQGSAYQLLGQTRPIIDLDMYESSSDTILEYELLTQNQFTMITHISYILVNTIIPNT